MLNHCGQDEKALIRLWQKKRGEVGPEDLSTNLIVQLGLLTEDLEPAPRDLEGRRAGLSLGLEIHQDET